MTERTEMRLYRYLSLQAFCELMYNKELTFKQPKSWPDQYEGYHYRLLETVIYPFGRLIC